MGADLLVMSINWTKKKGEKPLKGFRRRCDQIDSAIDKIKMVPASDQLDDIMPGAVGRPSVEEYKQYLYDRVDELRESWGGRDSAYLRYGNQEVFLTGGLSWGDSPCETFDILSNLAYARVC